MFLSLKLCIYSVKSIPKNPLHLPFKPSEYEKALHTSSSGNKVILKRDSYDCNINNYNPSVLLAWQANMDIQYVIDAYACVMYVASYMMKNEKSMGELLENVANEI